MSAPPVPPYLSLVIPTRNDEYPSNTVLVQGKCLGMLQRQLEESKIDSEILIIEYNPDPARPSLASSLQAAPGRHVTIRVIQVEPRLHQRFLLHREVPFHQTCAINAGLRRSRGKFFVYRAADHIYSEQLIRFLASRKLREDTIYRCDRVNVNEEVFDSATLQDWDTISSIFSGNEAFRFTPRALDPSYRIPDLYVDASGDFLLMARALWMRIAGLREERHPFFLDHDSLALHAAYSLCKNQQTLDGSCCVYKRDHAQKTTQRLQPHWSPRAKRWHKMLAARYSQTVQTASQILFNYPSRHDARHPAYRLDSFERHFVWPAFVWARGYGGTRQNRGRWGLKGIELPETVLSRGAWDHAGSR